eukprot:jgi/Tetstr1/422553/TSEL_013361.t1
MTRVPGSRHRLHRSHVACTRTTAVLYTEKGERTTLRRLPTSLVVDLYVAKLLNLGLLSVYVSRGGLLARSESGLELGLETGRLRRNGHAMLSGRPNL